MRIGRDHREWVIESIVDGQVEVGKIDQHRVEPATLPREALEPSRNGGAESARTGAGNDDVELRCQNSVSLSGPG